MKTYVKFGVLLAVIWLSITSITVGSEFDGTLTFNQGTYFWNVINSSGDQYVTESGSIDDNWIKFWAGCVKNNPDHRPPLDSCAAKGSAKSNHDTTCSGSIIGGHVMRRDPNGLAPNSNDTIYILPICGNHNHYRNYAQMTVVRDVTAVRLKNYKRSIPSNKDDRIIGACH
ncbi:MAG: hypothetical protein LBU70_09400 [Chitinispirillales bacterium]|nr:hypothetical protein [Chitinispirillales bacterium]